MWWRWPGRRTAPCTRCFADATGHGPWRRSACCPVLEAFYRAPRPTPRCRPWRRISTPCSCGLLPPGRFVAAALVRPRSASVRGRSVGGCWMLQVDDDGRVAALRVVQLPSVSCHRRRSSPSRPSPGDALCQIMLCSDGFNEAEKKWRALRPAGREQACGTAPGWRVNCPASGPHPASWAPARHDDVSALASTAHPKTAWGSARPSVLRQRPPAHPGARRSKPVFPCARAIMRFQAFCRRHCPGVVAGRPEGLGRGRRVSGGWRRKPRWAGPGRNEDCVFCDEASGVATVADGMGGHAGGHVVARLAGDALGGPPPGFVWRMAIRERDVRSRVAEANRAVFRWRPATRACVQHGDDAAAVCLRADGTLHDPSRGRSPDLLGWRDEALTCGDP